MLTSHSVKPMTLIVDTKMKSVLWRNVWQQMCGQMGLEAEHTDTSRNSQPPLQHITAASWKPLHADTYRNTNRYACSGGEADV